MLSLIAFGARAQTVGLFSCSGSVGTASAAIAFPGSGQTGPTGANHFLFLANPAASGGANLGINLSGGTAAIASAGTFTLAPGANITFTEPRMPNAPTIIASASSTPYTCDYK